MKEKTIKIHCQDELLTFSQINQDSFFLRFKDLCREKIDERDFQKWINHLEIYSFNKNEVIFSAPSKFIRDWVIREFLETKNKKKNIKNLSQEILPSIKKISIIFKEKISENITQEKETKVISISKYDNVFAFQTELNIRYKFNNFISAKYNKLAVSMAKIASGIDKQIALFDDKIPLFIHGGVGMGKTHLAQSIAWQIQEYDKSKKVVYLSAEKFMYHFVRSIRENNVMDFKEKMRSIDVLIVDDIQFIAGKESTQQEFMNCFNSLVEDNKQVVLVCDRCPEDLENIDEKLKSRISGGMVVNFKKPDFQDRVFILTQKSQEFNQNICEKVIHFIAEKITDSVRDLEGALKKLVAQNILLGEEITIDLAKVILSDYVKKSNEKAPTIAKIQKLVAGFYNIKISDLISQNRSRAIARPRQIAMYLAKNFTLTSLPKIGQEFGGKNHATVIHSVKLIEEMMSSNNEVLQDVKSLEEKMKI